MSYSKPLAKGQRVILTHAQKMEIVSMITRSLLEEEGEIEESTIHPTVSVKSALKVYRYCLASFQPTR